MLASYFYCLIEANWPQLVPQMVQFPHEPKVPPIPVRCFQCDFRPRNRSLYVSGSGASAIGSEDKCAKSLWSREYNRRLGRRSGAGRAAFALDRRRAGLVPAMIVMVDRLRF